LSFEKKNKDFTYFGGIIKNADPDDIPEGSASTSDNVDGNAPEGRLQGIPGLGSSISTTIAQNAFMSDWIKTSDGKWNLVYTTGSNTYIAKDFYGTLADAGFTIAHGSTSFAVHNQEVRIGRAAPDANYWAGYIPYGHFGGSAHGWQATTAALPQPSTSDCAVTHGTAYTASGITNFDSEKTYEYNVSFTYDGIQESPLSSTVVALTPPVLPVEYWPMGLVVKSVSGLAKRITAVNLYRREVLPGSPAQRTLYRLLQTFDITSATAFTDRNGATQAWVTSGADKTIAFNDYNDIMGASYEDNTGISETLPSSFVYYGLNCISSGYHFVALATKSGVPDANLMVFRSSSYRYDMFDWTTSFVKLPTQPTALVAFANKVWAFDENRTYIINPTSMVIESITEGVGCSSQRSIRITDYGMFWCDYKNAYMHDGSTLTPIGESIKATSGEWHGFTRVETPIVCFDSQKNYIIFMISNSTGTTCNVWAYHVARKRWDSWINFATTGATMGMFTGKNGESYIATGSNLYATFGSATNKAVTWVSGSLLLGNASVKKRFYNFSSEPTSNVSLLYSLDGGSFVAQSTTPLQKLNAKKIRIKVVISASTSVVNSASFFYREFEGNR
jgi:hypothetical protein